MSRSFVFAVMVFAALVAADVTDAAVAAPATPRQLSDGPGGATCRHYSAAGRLGWRRPMGDWEDANAVPFGDTPFASASTGPAAVLLPVSFDVTSLVREWITGKSPSTGMLLRTTAGKGIVAFRSRESADEWEKPVLQLEWSDGTRQNVSPIADTYLDCSTYKSLGGLTTFRVGPDKAGLLAFDVPAGNKPLARATLVLHPVKHYAGQSRIGIFRAAPAWADAMPATERGIADRFTRDKGIDRDPDVLFTASFDQSGWQGLWQQLTKDTGGVTVVEDRSNDFVPFDGKALKATLKKGVNNALNVQYKFARNGGQEPEEVYFRYYIRLGKDWSPDIEGGKLPGLAGTYGKSGWGMRKSDGSNGWSIRGGFAKRPTAGDGSALLTPIGSYVYHADMRGPTGEYWGWNMGPGGLLENNRWYSIEQYLKLNTPGQKDGVYRAWIDGNLVYVKTGLRLRDDSTIKIESIWMNVYHGGSTPPPRDMSLYIDNVIAARRYIGPAAP